MPISTTVSMEDEMLDRPATLAERNAATGINEALAAWQDASHLRALEKALEAFRRSRGMTKRQLFAWINERRAPRVGSVDAAIIEDVAAEA